MQIIHDRDVNIVGQEYNPIYRVVLIEPNDGALSTWSRESISIFGGDIEDALRFAASEAKGRLFAVALETVTGARASPARYQLTWLHGLDPIFPEQLHEAAFLRMQQHKATGA